MEKETGAECIFCGGEVVEKIEREFVGSGLPIDGPGSEKQYAYVSREFHCKVCKIKYESPPPKKEKIRRKIDLKCPSCGEGMIIEEVRESVTYPEVPDHFVGNPGKPVIKKIYTGYSYCDKCGRMFNFGKAQKQTGA